MIYTHDSLSTFLSCLFVLCLISVTFEIQSISNVDLIMSLTATESTAISLPAYSSSKSTPPRILRPNESSTNTTASDTLHKEENSPLYLNEPMDYIDNSIDRLNDLYRLLCMEKGLGELFEDKVRKGMSTLEAFRNIFSQNIIDSDKASDTINAQSAISNSPGQFLYTGTAAERTKNNCYIIRLIDGAGFEEMAKLQSILKPMKGSVRRTFEHSVKGLIACFPPGELPLAVLRSIPLIKFVERDQVFRAEQVQTNAPWGLARLTNPKQSKKTLKDDFFGGKDSNSGTYTFGLTGSGVNVYVIDSGVLTDHPEFGGRASIGFSVFSSSEEDCAGHGTEVSSVIGGINVGVAKQANLIIAQVLDCDGAGQNSDLVAALDWIVKNYKAPGVINMSVGGPKSTAVDQAVRRVIQLGIPVVVAAGNSNTNACQLSPSGIDGVISVAASTELNHRANFSNYGQCIDIFAPGTHIAAACIPEKAILNGIGFVSGTSLSAPFVTGIVALLLQANSKMSPLEIAQTVKAIGAKGALSGYLHGSPNLLAQVPKLGNYGQQLVALGPAEMIPIYTGGASQAAESPVEIIMIIASAAAGAILAVVLLIFLIKKLRARRKARTDFMTSSHDGTTPKTPARSFM